jgi:hypothetical protein
MNHLLLPRLTRLLYTPRGHPRLYRLAHRPPPSRAFKTPFLPLIQLIGALLLCGMMLSPLILLLLAGVLVLLVFNGTVFGGWWAAQMAALLADLRARGVDDLYAVQPSGRLGLHLAISSGILHRLESLPNLHRTIQTTCAVIAALILFSLGIILINAQVRTDTLAEQRATLNSLDVTFNLLTLLALFYLDHLSSMVLCALCGMLAPTWASRPMDARLWAVSLFLSLQGVSYAAWGLLALWLLPALVPASIGGWDRLLVLTTQLLLFLLVREAAIRALWCLLLHRLEVGPAETP